MNSNRLLIVLVALTLVLQAASTYRQYRKPNSLVVNEPVVDAPQGILLDVADLPAEGDVTVTTVLIEFSDYECPFCRRHARTVQPELLRRFVSNAKVRLMFVNNPLAIHRNAPLMATAGICAHQQQRFWEMHDRLFMGEVIDKKESALRVAEELGIDMDRFALCA
jgi:protein-disulfide isomerase